MPTARPTTRPARLLVLAGSALGLASPALAQTWTGLSGTTSNWTDAANWSALPVNTGAANLTFSGNARLNNTLNANWDINSLTFNNLAGAFVISGPGNTLTLRGGITSNDADTQTLAMGTLAVPIGQTWTSNVGPLAILPTQVNLNATVNVNTTGTGSVAINTVVTGAGLLTKLGPGTLFMGLGTIASTNTGLISVVQGSLQTTSNNAISDFAPVSISSGASLILGGTSEVIHSLAGGPSSAVNLQAGTLTLNHDGADTVTFPGAISGSGSLTKLGTYTQVLSGPNAYSGTTTVSNGTLRVDADERLANSSILTINNSGILDLQGFSETVLAVNQTGGELGPFMGLNGTLVANAYNLEGGVTRLRLSGNGGITKSNPAFNYLIFSGGNTFAGPVNITGGTLSSNALDCFPDTTNVTVNTPGVWQVLNFPDTVAGISGTGTINIVNATLTVGGNNASSAFLGVIGDGGSTGNLTKIGTGQLTLAGANTYRATTTLNDGTLRLQGAERLADVSNVVINGGQFVTQAETINTVTLNGGELRGNIIGVGSLSANLYFFNSGFCDAVLSGPGGLIKASPALVSLGATNNSPSFVRVDAGTLEVPAASSLGLPDSNVLLNGGTLRLTRSMTLPVNLSVGSSSAIECLGDVTLPSFSLGIASGGLSKIGPGRLILNGAAGTCTALGVNAGEVVLSNLSIPINGISVGAAGTLTVDGALLSLTSGFSNLGRVQLAHGGRILGTTWGNNGVITGSGTIAATITNNATGDVRVGENESIFFSGAGTFTNAGLFEALGGTAEFAGPVINSSSTGLIYARDAALRFNAGLTNFGGLALSFGVTDVFGDLDNRAAGVITISGASDATFVDDVINNGTLRTSTGSASVFLGALSGSGTFPGTGTVFMEGDLRPGNSPGRMTFGGDLIIGTFAAMQAEVGGTNPGTFDTIDVAGTVVLDGTLDVSFVRDFRPSGCDSLTIIHANAVVGSFHTVHLPNNSALFYHPDRVELLLSGCPADLDDGSSTGTPDCGVTVDDLLYFIDGYTLGLLRADLDDGSSTGTPDGGVTIDDLLYYLDRYTGGC